MGKMLCSAKKPHNKISASFTSSLPKLLDSLLTNCSKIDVFVVVLIFAFALCFSEFACFLIIVSSATNSFLHHRHCLFNLLVDTERSHALYSGKFTQA
jgi:hypothetical protein